MMTKWAASNLCSPKCGQGEEAEPESPIGKVSLGANLWSPKLQGFIQNKMVNLNMNNMNNLV